MADGGLGTIQTSQAGSMTTNDAPNDLLANFNPLTIIVMAPVMNYLVRYELLLLVNNVPFIDLLVLPRSIQVYEKWASIFHQSVVVIIRPCSL